VRNVKNFGAALRRVHLRDKTRTLHGKICQNANTGDVDDEFNGFLRSLGKKIYKKVNGHVAAGSEARAGSEKHNNHNAEKLNFFTPYYRPVNKIAHNNRAECYDYKDCHSCAGNNKIEIQNFLKTFIIHKESPCEQTGSMKQRGFRK
jgi:hypothetical protein